MRILIITATYSPSINGVALSIELQKNELEKRGHSITILAPKHPNQKEETGVIRIPSVPNPKDQDYPIILPIPTFHNLKIFTKKFDLVYFHHPFYIGELSLKLAKYFGSPSIFFYHSQYEKVGMIFKPKFLPAFFISNFIKKNVIHIASKSNQVIIETESGKQKLLQQSITTPINIIPSVRKPVEISISKNELREKYNLGINQLIILCVSRLSKEKNLAALIKMFAKIKVKTKLNLCLVGDGPETENLKKLSEKLNISSCCKFLGRIDYEKIHEIYSLADIFAFPSKTEVQPGVITEALIYGLPVIGFNTPGPKDMIINEVNGYLVSSELEFMDRLQLLIQDSNKRDTIRKKALLMSKEYSFKDSINRLENLFYKVISEYKAK